jgi:hypothetical protein
MGQVGVGKAYSIGACATSFLQDFSELSLSFEKLFTARPKMYFLVCFAAFWV